MTAFHKRGTILQPGTVVQVNEADVLFLPTGAKFAYRVRKDFITYPAEN
jgi:hypothetical protein